MKEKTQHMNFATLTTASASPITQIDLSPTESQSKQANSTAQLAVSSQVKNTCLIELFKLR
jgi:hypothetical protein